MQSWLKGIITLSPPKHNYEVIEFLLGPSVGHRARPLVVQRRRTGEQESRATFGLIPLLDVQKTTMKQNNLLSASVKLEEHNYSGQTTEAGGQWEGRDFTQTRPNKGRKRRSKNVMQRWPGLVWRAG